MAAEALLRPSDWGTLARQGRHWRHGDDEAGPLCCEIGAGTSTPLLLAFNPEPADAKLALPAGRWVCLLDSAGLTACDTANEALIMMAARSLAILKRLPA